MIITTCSIDHQGIVSGIYDAKSSTVNVIINIKLLVSCEFTAIGFVLQVLKSY